MSASVALRLAGQVFERLRASGETLEGAMCEAERTLHAARDAVRSSPESESAGAVPPFAWDVLLQVATHYRVTVDAMQLRGGAVKVVAARGEAATILVRLGLQPEQVGRLLRRDRYAASAAVRQFGERLKTEPVLHARVEHLVAVVRAELAAHPEPDRRPAVRAPIPDTNVEVTQGGV